MLEVFFVVVVFSFFAGEPDVLYKRIKGCGDVAAKLCWHRVDILIINWQGATYPARNHCKSAPPEALKEVEPAWMGLFLLLHFFHQY